MFIFLPAPVSATEVIDVVIKNNPLKHYQRPVKHVDDLITVRVSFFVQNVREFVSFNITSQCHTHSHPFPEQDKIKILKFQYEKLQKVSIKGYVEMVPYFFPYFINFQTLSIL